MTDIRLTSDITVTPLHVLGDDQFVIGAMKVLGEVPSPDKSDRGRIRYLMEHRHGTPFEHNCVICCVHAPIFVWREWHRHRIGFSYNEESARYSQLKPCFFIPHRDRPMAKIAEAWKPGRPKFLTLDEEAEGKVRAEPYHVDKSDEQVKALAKIWADRKYSEITEEMRQGYEDEYARYERQLARSLDPGLARDNLPVGIYSSCWVTCNLRSALAFLSLRTHDPAAKFVSYPLFEIERGARQLEEVVKTNFPICHEAFCDFGRIGP